MFVISSTGGTMRKSKLKLGDYSNQQNQRIQELEGILKFIIYKANLTPEALAANDDLTRGPDLLFALCEGKRILEKGSMYYQDYREWLKQYGY
jgi:hypothetical protein